MPIAGFCSYLSCLMDPSYNLAVSILTRQSIAALVVFCSLSTQALAMASGPCSFGEKTTTVLSKVVEHHAEAAGGHQHHNMMSMDLPVGSDSVTMDCCGDASGCDMAQCLGAASAVNNVLLGTSPGSSAPDYLLMHKHALNHTTTLFKPPISL
jgi:hypothetical protein